MEKPQNTFKILNKLKNVGLRRQLQAQLAQLPNLPDPSDLIEIAICLFPDSVQSKIQAVNMATVFTKLYRCDPSKIVEIIQKQSPNTQQFFDSFLNETSTEEDSQKNQSQSTGLAIQKKRGRKPKSLSQSRVQSTLLNSSNNAEQNTSPRSSHNFEIFTQIFKQYGVGIRSNYDSIQYCDQECLALLRSAQIEDQYVIQSSYVKRFNFEVDDTSIISTQQIPTNQVFLILDGSVSTPEKQYQFVFHKFQNQTTIKQIDDYMNGIYYIQYGKSFNQINLTFDSNSGQLCDKLQFGTDEQINCDIVLTMQFTQPVFSLRSTKFIEKGDALFISNQYQWFKSDSIFAQDLSDIGADMNYQVQYLRSVLKSDIFVQNAVQTFNSAQNSPVALDAENSMLRLLFAELCDLTKSVKWESAKEGKIEDIIQFQQLLEARDQYGMQIGIRPCDLLGFW